MKKLSITLSFLFLSHILFSQVQTVRGVILDLDSEMPLIGATVQHISAASLGTTTDIDGNFELANIPTGRQSFVVQYLGYETQYLNELLITPSKEVVLTIKLKESVAQLEVVEVKASKGDNKALNEMSMISARSMTIEELNRTPANFYDPARMAVGFLGVSSGDDESNEIIVRGNSPNTVLWRMEGVEIPNPNHFSEAGTSGGGISMLSTNAMGTSDFFAGAFPSEFGNALSSVFDIKLRKGNHTTTEAALQIGVLGINAAVEGPISKANKSSYLFNYRYSTLGILQKAGLFDAGVGTPDFQDLSFKIHLPTTNMGTFSIFGLGGLSISKDDYNFGGSPRRDIFSNKTEIVGMSHLAYLSPKTYLKTVAMTSYSGKFYDEGRLGVFSEDDFDNDYKESFEDKVSRLSVLFNHKFNSQHVLRIGGVYSNLGYNLTLENRLFNLLQNPNGSITRQYTDQWDSSLESEGNTFSLQQYLQWKYYITNQLTLNAGFHFMYFGLNKNSSFEPRLGLQWQFHPQHSLAIALGRHSIIEPISTYFVQRTQEDGSVVLPNRNLPLQNALHYILAYTWNINPNLSFKLETYYQQLRNLPISNEAGSNVALSNLYYFDVFFDVPGLIGTGKGRNYGIDMGLEKRFSNDYYFIFNTSLFQSQYQTTTNQWYSTRFNSNMNLVLIGGKEFHFEKKRKHTIGVNGKILYNRGLRYTPIDETASLAQQQSIYETDAYNRHLPAYWRIDVGLNYQWYKNKVVHRITLNVQNTTNRENVFSRVQFYNPTQQRIISFDNTQLSIIPVLSYRIEF